MRQPLVSVIIPAYNCAPYLGEAIRSVLDQDYAPLEVLIVNDGSTDDTSAVARSFGSPVRVIDQSNGGAAAARNRGLRETSGEYVAFLDGDDVWLPRTLATRVAHLERDRELGAVYGEFRNWLPDATGALPPPSTFEVPEDAGLVVPELSGWIYPKLLLTNWICIITSVVRRDALDAVGGFDERLPVAEDWEFWLRFSRKYPVLKLKAVVALYRRNPTSLTSKPRAVLHAAAVVNGAIEQWGTSGPDGTEVDRHELRSRMARLYFGHGYHHVRHGSPGVALRAFWHAARQRPLWPANLLYLVLAAIRSVAGRGRD